MMISDGGFFYEKNYDLSQEKNMDGFSCMCISWDLWEGLFT